MPLEIKYFVLKPRNKKGEEKYDPHAEASRAAMKAYAANISEYDPWLANELLLWVQAEEERATKRP